MAKAGRPITASMLHDHLTCPHRVTMDHFADPARRDPVSPFVQLLWERGTAYEREVMSGLGEPVLDLSGIPAGEREQATRDAIANREPLIYQGRLFSDGLLGLPDLLRLEGDGYVAIDIKSGAGEEGGAEDEAPGKPKKTYGVQLALYTDLLQRADAAAGRYGYILDVHGEEVRYELDAPLGRKTPSLWELYLGLRQAVEQTLTGPGQTAPALASVCKQCVWRSSCLAELSAAQDLTLLPELGRAKRDVLAAQFPTVRDLAVAPIERFFRGKKTDFPGIGPDTLRKLKARAQLATAADPQPYLTKRVAWPATPVELFFDIETDPMRDLVYLHGFVIRQDGDSSHEKFVGIFAKDVTPEAEREAFAQAWAVFREHLEAAVYVYSAYERTNYRRLQQRYPDVCSAEEVEALFSRPETVDLYYDVVKSGTEWPTTDFSIKSLAKFLGFEWRDTDPSGASSIEWFARWVETRDPALRKRLLEYNEDDCRAMRVVLDGMREMEVRS